MMMVPLHMFVCPSCSGPFELFLYSFQPAYGVLKCGCGEMPIVHSIPIFVKFPWQKRVVDAIKVKETREALLMTLACFSTHSSARDGSGCLFLRSTNYRQLDPLLDAPLVTFKAALEALCSPEEHNAGFFRYCTGSFVGSVALQAVLPDPKQALVHLGCGAGHLERVLCARMPPSQVVGVDRRFHLLYLAKRFLAPDAFFACADPEQRLPFRNRSFDQVLSSDLFNELKAPDAAAREISRVATDDANHVHAWLKLAPSDVRRFCTGRMYSARALLRGFIEQRSVDLGTQTTETEEVISAVSSANNEIFTRHAIGTFVTHRTLQVNPIYSVVEQGERLLLSRRKEDSEAVVDPVLAHCGALPESVEIPRENLKRLQEGMVSPDIEELIYKMVLVDIPLDYL